MLDVKKAILRDEKRKARNRERYANDPQYREHQLSYKRTWEQANRDKTRLYTKRARAKKRALKAAEKNRAG